MIWRVCVAAEFSKIMSSYTVEVGMLQTGVYSVETLTY
jgi:hypothetical protein